MQQRNPAAVFLLTLITFGIYGIVWQVKTKNELNSLGAEIPTAWLLIVPVVSIYWLWKYSEGVEKATGGATSGVLAFVMLFLLGVIGMAILQNEFNKLSGQAPVGAAPMPAQANPGSMPPQPIAVSPPVGPAAVVSPDVTAPTPFTPPASNGPADPTQPIGTPPSPIQ